MIDIKISSTPINVSRCIKKVASPKCGGIASFIGTVRVSTKGKTVVRLEYEAYESMALKEMHKIATYVFDKWLVENILIYHRSGILEIGEVSVVIATSASHRKAALESCRYIIDTLKQTVPIWKKEVFEDNETWVNDHP